MILGIDIGGTGIKFGVVSDDYRILKSDSIPTNSHRPIAEIIGDMVAKAKELREEYAFDRIGIGTPGDIDSENGVCKRAANLPYDETPMVAMISEAIGLPVYIANDATAALYGELYAGAGKDYENIIMITLGTGVGGGIAINGKPYLGSKGYGGEIGHMIIKYDGLPCPCGLTGCYEQYASVTALVRQAEEILARHPDSLLASMTHGRISVPDIFTAKEKGCPVAAEIIDRYAGFVAIGLNALENIFQPEAFIIGGAISKQEENLLGPIRAKLDKPDRARLTTSGLKNDAGIIGAAVIAVEMAK
ncbi:MAG: ROK family protein [Clostridiales bacterium]|nr:ROK family protein [Clostridiales bacterium]